MALVLISLLIFSLYLTFAIRHIGLVPQSLSETYYLIGGEPFSRLKASIFTVAMWIIAFTLVPSLFQITRESMQFLAFLAIAGICFVGAAPEFRERFEGKVHTAAAIVSACFGILWSVLMPYGFLGLGLAAFCALTGALATGTLKDCKTFWLEMIAFGCVYLTAIFNLL